MTDRELMQEALYALTYVGDAKEIYSDTIESLRARLAQPNEFEPDWDAMAVMVEEQQRMAKRIEELETALAQPEQEPVATLFGSLPVYDVPPKQEPVAWVENLENARPHCVTDLKYCSVAQHERGEHLKYIPLHTAPPQQHSEQWWRHEVSNAWAEGYEKGRSQREWKGLADEEILEEYRQSYGDDGNLTDIYFAHAIEAKLKEKNA